MRRRGVWSTLIVKRAVILRDPRASGLVIIFPFRLPSRIPLRVRALGHVSLVPHTVILSYCASPTAALTGMQLLTDIISAADLQIELSSREIVVVYG